MIGSGRYWVWVRRFINAEFSGAQTELNECAVVVASALERIVMWGVEVKKFFVQRVAYPIWLLMLAVYTVFRPELIERIMANHNAAIQAKRRERLDELSRPAKL